MRREDEKSGTTRYQTRRFLEGRGPEGGRAALLTCRDVPGPTCHSQRAARGGDVAGGYGGHGLPRPAIRRAPHCSRR
jgi:hypothetical protein